MTIGNIPVHRGQTQGVALSLDAKDDQSERRALNSLIRQIPPHGEIAHACLPIAMTSAYRKRQLARTWD